MHACLLILFGHCAAGPGSGGARLLAPVTSGPRGWVTSPAIRPASSDMLGRMSPAWAGPLTDSRKDKTAPVVMSGRGIWSR